MDDYVYVGCSTKCCSGDLREDSPCGLINCACSTKTLKHHPAWNQGIHKHWHFHVRACNILYISIKQLKLILVLIFFVVCGENQSIQPTKSRMHQTKDTFSESKCSEISAPIFSYLKVQILLPDGMGNLHFGEAMEICYSYPFTPIGKRIGCRHENSPTKIPDCLTLTMYLWPFLKNFSPKCY